MHGQEDPISVCMQKAEKSLATNFFFSPPSPNYKLSNLNLISNFYLLEVRRGEYDWKIRVHGIDLCLMKDVSEYLFILQFTSNLK